MAVSASFKITMTEGIEVVFIVIATGGAGQGLLIPASIGALAALVLVVLLGLALHKPVAMIPKNTLKFVVGILLCSFGAFWVGEGMGFAWPGQDLALGALNAGFLATALVLVPLCRARASRRSGLRSTARRAGMNVIKSIWSELIGLFVDDGSFAIAILLWLVACWLVLPRFGLPSFLPPAILLLGLVVILAESAVRRVGQRQ